MAEVYFLGDGHFAHRNILKYRPEFESIEHHDQTIITNINNLVTSRDKMFFMSDWVFDATALNLIRQINCPNKHLILGNHDDFHVDFHKAFNWVSGPIKYKEFWLTHIPVHPAELRGKMNIHGHMHRAKIVDKRYFCTSCEQLNYTPISLQDLRKIMHNEAPKEGMLRTMFNALRS